MSAINAARAGKWGNICLSNNVSATMCLRLPGPQGRWVTGMLVNFKNPSKSENRLGLKRLKLQVKIRHYKLFCWLRW